MPSLRLLWMALILVLVVPLYGQVSCNRNCPPSSNPCQRSAGPSIETGQCIYTNIDGATCDDGGVLGICSGGQCIASECAGLVPYDFCNEPLNGEEMGACIDDPCVGACVEDLCVLAAPDDECVRVGVGRVNCCTQDGCKSSSGAYCTQPLEDDTPCDPTGVEPPGQTGQDGLCQAGTCVAQTGLCADRWCETTVDDPCARKYCDSDVGQCAEWPIESFFFVGCYSAQGLDGVCAGGLGCVEQENPTRCGAVNGVGGVVCDDGNPCTHNNCVNAACEYPNVRLGEPCQDGVSGQCVLGTCMQPLFCQRRDDDENGNDDDCEDGNPCTQNTCGLPGDPVGGICNTLIFDDDTPCLGGQGICRNGVCLPDLCIGRDCGDPDGNPCTGVCISPYGICDNDADLPNGTSCPDGQCLNGFCQPILTSECDHEPNAPDREFPECDDGKECTYNRCDFADQCINPRKPNGTPCANGNGSCIFGGCALNGGGGGLGL